MKWTSFWSSLFFIWSPTNSKRLAIKEFQIKKCNLDYSIKSSLIQVFPRNNIFFTSKLTTLKQHFQKSINTFFRKLKYNLFKFVWNNFKDFLLRSSSSICKEVFCFGTNLCGVSSWLWSTCPENVWSIIGLLVTSKNSSINCS